MSVKHFIFHPGTWIGEGNISFSSSPKKIHFYTKWIVGEEGPSGIYCEQQVEMQGGHDRLYNRVVFSKIVNGSFVIQLANEAIENGTGEGIYNEQNLAWEFPAQTSQLEDSHFEGFEIYTLKSDLTYEIHAEYSSGDAFKTIIDGRLWKK